MKSISTPSTFTPPKQFRETSYAGGNAGRNAGRNTGGNTGRILPGQISRLLAIVVSASAVLIPVIASADPVKETLLQPSYYTRSTQHFGKAVDLHENRVITGAPQTLSSGDAYIHERDAQGNWSELARLLPPADAQSVSNFGKSVALIDSHAFVAANASFQVGSGDRFLLRPQTISTGVVFVYKKTGAQRWRYERQFFPSGGVSSYGDSIAVESDRLGYNLVVGAPYFRDTNLRRTTGAAYIYEPLTIASPFGQGHKETSLYPDLPLPASQYSDPEADSMIFGHDVDIDNDRVLIGAPGWYDSNGSKSQAGSAFIYKKNPLGQWIETQAMPLIAVRENHEYGHSVALQGELAVIGNPCGATSHCGGAHIFEYSSSSALFTHTFDLEPFGDTPNHFGSAVALHDIRILVGSESGDAFLFKKIPSSSDWNPQENWTESHGPIWESDSSSLAINADFFAIGRKYDEVSHADARYTDTGRTQMFRIDELLLPVFEEQCEWLSTDCYFRLPQ